MYARFKVSVSLLMAMFGQLTEATRNSYSLTYALQYTEGTTLCNEILIFDNLWNLHKFSRFFCAFVILNYRSSFLESAAFMFAEKKLVVRTLVAHASTFLPAFTYYLRNK